MAFISTASIVLSFDDSDVVKTNNRRDLENSFSCSHFILLALLNVSFPMGSNVSMTSVIQTVPSWDNDAKFFPALSNAN